MYTLSYYKPQTVTRLVQRPWWAFWRHDTMVKEQILTRIVFCDLSEDEAQFIMRATTRNWTTAEGRVLAKVMGPGAEMVQLEQTALATPYVATEYAPTNYVSNSDPPNTEAETRHAGAVTEP